jgi:hypothetical protein
LSFARSRIYPSPSPFSALPRSHHRHTAVEGSSEINRREAADRGKEILTEEDEARLQAFPQLSRISDCGLIYTTRCYRTVIPTKTLSPTCRGRKIRLLSRLKRRLGCSNDYEDADRQAENPQNRRTLFVRCLSCNCSGLLRPLKKPLCWLELHVLLCMALCFRCLRSFSVQCSRLSVIRILQASGLFPRSERFLKYARVQSFYA